MNKELKIIKNIVLGVGILILSTLSVHAGFGVSPTDISYENLKPGATFTKSFTLSRSGDLEELDVFIEPELEEIDSWFAYKPGRNFTFEAGATTKTFEVTVNVPQDAKYQNYDGVIRVKAVPSGSEIRGVTITQGVRLDAGLVVTETDIRTLSIISIKALDSVEGEPIKLEIIGENQGNVDASPVVNVSVMDLQMNVLETHEIVNFGFVKPNETSTMIAEFETNLPSGEYFLEVDVLLDGTSLRKERLVIDIKNIPEEEKDALITEPSSKFSGFISSIKEFLGDNYQYIIYSVIAVTTSTAVYIILDKVWTLKKTQKFKKMKEKVWAIFLGSKNTTRIAISISIGYLIFLGLFIYHARALEQVEIRTIAVREVQGIQDDNSTTDSLLQVFPSIKVPQYLIYEESDTNSEILYEAQDGQDFDVVDEIEDWYKVQLPDGSNGWLEKTDIKSKLTQGE